jgi:alkylation response protein AidB-like acyl-CoA dehydrogenase
MLAHRRVYNEEHAIFRDAVRRFIADQITPNFARWEERGLVDRVHWVEGGQRGLLCPQVPSADRGGSLRARGQVHAFADDQFVRGLCGTRVREFLGRGRGYTHQGHAHVDVYAGGDYGGWDVFARSTAIYRNRVKDAAPAPGV